MSWITLALIAMFFKSFQTLIIRLLGKSDFTYHTILVAIFVSTAFAGFLVTWVSGDTFTISGLPLLAIFGAAAIGSYAGGSLEVRSVSVAPNAGYALSLINSFTIVAVLGSVVFFNDPLSPLKFFGILIIIGASALLIYDKQSSVLRKGGNSWIFMSLGSVLLYGILTLLSRYALNSGVHSPLLLAYLSIFVLILLLFDARLTQTPINIMSVGKRNLFAIFVASIGFNLLAFEAFRTAPNIGYVTAIITGASAIVAIFSAMYFKDHFSPTKFLGIAGIIAGITIVAI